MLAPKLRHDKLAKLFLPHQLIHHLLLSFSGATPESDKDEEQVRPPHRRPRHACGNPQTPNPTPSALTFHLKILTINLQNP